MREKTSEENQKLCVICGIREAEKEVCPICWAYKFFFIPYELGDPQAKAIMGDLKEMVRDEDEIRLLFYLIWQLTEKFGDFVSLEELMAKLKESQLEHLYNVVLKHAMIGIALDKETMQRIMPDCETSKIHICIKDDNKFYCLKCGKEAPLKKIKSLRVDNKEVFRWEDSIMSKEDTLTEKVSIKGKLVKRIYSREDRTLNIRLKVDNPDKFKSLIDSIELPIVLKIFTEG